MISGVASEWADVVKKRGYDAWPFRVEGWWKLVMRHQRIRLTDVRKYPDLVEALVSIVASCDQVSFGFGFPVAGTTSDLPIAALLLSDKKHSLGYQVEPSRAYVLPKLHNPLVGITLRSLTHNLGLWENCEVTPHWLSGLMQRELKGLNLLLLPWPLEVGSHSFNEVKDGESAVAMSSEYGFFAYDFNANPIDRELLRKTVKAARDINQDLHALVFPELSMSEGEFDDIRDEFDDLLVIAGFGTMRKTGSFGGNRVGIGWPGFDEASFQDKHHRWQLNKDQIDMYDLSSVLPSKDYYWEAIEMKPRACSFFNVNEWLTMTVLVCEDLARQDPVAELVRSVGPNLVVALLMDGPQIEKRWSARYATILAEDPRSSVLTLTSAGLVDRANASWARKGHPAGRRSVGLWKEATGDAVELVLDQAAAGILLELGHDMRGEWTADARHDGGRTGYVTLKALPSQILP